MNGATLRTYRKLLGYDTQQFADRIHVNRRTLTRWETDAFDIPDDVATQIHRDIGALISISGFITDRNKNRAHCTLTLKRPATSPEDIIYNAGTGLAALNLQNTGTDVTIEWANNNDDEDDDQ